MPARLTRSTALLSTVLMAWLSVWCCCVPAAKAAHLRPCCMEQPAATSSSCPLPMKTPGDCPIFQVRQVSESPQPAVTPPAHDVLFALPTPPALLPVLISMPQTDARPASADPPMEPPTLLALHTSLVS